MNLAALASFASANITVSVSKYDNHQTHLYYWNYNKCVLDRFTDNIRIAYGCTYVSHKDYCSYISFP